MTGASGSVFDAGLQAERTALAWRRTALAMSVAAVGVGRMALPVLGAFAILVAATGLLQALVVVQVSSRRYRAMHASLTGRGDLLGVRAAGLPIAALACSGFLVGILALGFVVAG